MLRFISFPEPKKIFELACTKGIDILHQDVEKQILAKRCLTSAEQSKTISAAHLKIRARHALHACQESALDSTCPQKPAVKKEW